MLETCAFISGDIADLEQPYQYVENHYLAEPNFKGMQAFLSCHLDRKLGTRTSVLRALRDEPHNPRSGSSVQLPDLG